MTRSLPNQNQKFEINDSIDYISQHISLPRENINLSDNLGPFENHWVNTRTPQGENRTRPTADMGAVKTKQIWTCIKAHGPVR